MTVAAIALPSKHEQIYEAYKHYLRIFIAVREVNKPVWVIKAKAVEFLKDPGFRWIEIWGVNEDEVLEQIASYNKLIASNVGCTTARDMVKGIITRATEAEKARFVMATHLRSAFFPDVPVEEELGDSLWLLNRLFRLEEWNDVHGTKALIQALDGLSDATVQDVTGQSRQDWHRLIDHEIYLCR